MSRLSIRWRPGGLARSGLVLLGWMLLRAAMQAATVASISADHVRLYKALGGGWQ